MRMKHLKSFVFSLLFSFVLLSGEEFDVGGPHTEPVEPVIGIVSGQE